MLAWFIFSTLGRDFLPLWSTYFGKWNNHVVAFLMSFLRVPSFTLIPYYFFLHFGFCKAYRNWLVALIKISAVYISEMIILKLLDIYIVDFFDTASAVERQG